MFSNIVVGIDGGQGGRDAIALARQLGSATARITLAHAYGELIELAEQRDANLLVVGSSRHALPGHALMGDDCREAVSGARRAIAIAPLGWERMASHLTCVGVGYDGSAHGMRALSAARALAARHGARIKAAWVISLQRVREERPFPDDWPRTIEKLVDRCSDRLDALWDVQGTATFAGPREELTRFGDGLDLLIVGARRDGPIGSVSHESVSSYLVGHAPCPVLVLPPAVRDDGRRPATAPAGDALIAAGC